MNTKADSLTEPREKVSLAPISIWKWLITIIVILTIPIITLVQQALETFKSSAEFARSSVATEVEGLASRIAVEMKTTLQLNEIFREYYFHWQKNLQSLHLFNEFQSLNKLPMPTDFFIASKLVQKAFSHRLQSIDRKLRLAIPGIQLIKWDDNYQILPESDNILPKWAFTKLHESITLRVSERDSGDRNYLSNLAYLQRYFGEDAPIGQFLKFGSESMEFTATSGERFFIFWDYERLPTHAQPKQHIGGFIILVNLEKLPESFGLDMLLRRKSSEWEKSEISVGWISNKNQREHLLPFPFPAYESESWARWIARKPDGHFEKDGISIAKRITESGLILVSARCIKSIEEIKKKKVFWLLIFIGLCLFLPLISVFRFRSNNGVNMSIRSQILALFAISLLLPVAAIILLGSELLNDRQRIYENDAYVVLEKIKKDFEKNSSYAFRHLEEMSDNLCQKIIKLKINEKGKLADNALAEKILKDHENDLQFSHFYMLNSSGETILSVSSRDNSKEGAGLEGLVQSLAKIKLRFSGHLRSSSRMGDVSMMDLLVEATGGAGHLAVKNILNARENKAFELKLSDNRIILYLGEFFPESKPDEAHILVLLMKDTDFEKMFIRLMIERLAEDDRLLDKIQLFFGMTSFSRKNYFYPSPLQKAWFPYTQQNPDTMMVGQLSEPTRYDGLAVKDSVFLQSSHKKCLFYSFSPAGLDRTILVALFDYSSIDAELFRIKLFILVSFLVSLIVVYVLARIMSRSLIEPVSILTEGVKMVEQGNYNIQIEMPGKDELVELSDAFNLMTIGLDERDRMTRYLSRSAVEAVVKKEDGIMGGKRVPATILFSDIRSFTTISESNNAETVVALLNDYFAIMNRVIEEHGGDIDKFIGDAIMAQFMQTEDQGSESQKAVNAVYCALSMMKALKAFNHQRQAMGLFPIKIGVGINSGEVIAGNIGSPGRMDRTVIGDVVNVASRLEGMSKQGKHTCIVISAATLELVKDKFIVEKMSETAVKGKISAVDMFEIVDQI